jgi:hypothetical protein
MGLPPRSLRTITLDENGEPGNQIHVVQNWLEELR